MTNERKLEAIHVGGLAEIALRIVDQEIDKVKQSRLHEVMGKYRAGQSTNDGLIGLIASLCALEDIQAGLRQKITAGKFAEKERIEND